MPQHSTLRLIAFAAPPALLVMAGTIWLWLRYGMSIYFDAAMGALAGCF